jgi:hypothetical protein
LIIKNKVYPEPPHQRGEGYRDQSKKIKKKQNNKVIKEILAILIPPPQVRPGPFGPMFRTSGQATYKIMFSKKPENLSTEELLWKIYKSTERTRRYILWGRVVSFIYFLLIVVPIILAIIYLPPMLNNVLEPYRGLINLDTNKLDLTGSSADTQQKLNDLLKSNGLNLNQLLEMYKK